MRQSLPPVILGNHTNTRVLLLSGPTLPKQDGDLADGGEQMLQQQIHQWLAGTGELQAPLLVCNEGRLFNLGAQAVVSVAEKIRQIGVEPATELPRADSPRNGTCGGYGGTGGHSPSRRRAARAAGRPGDRRCGRLPCRGEH